MQIRQCCTRDRRGALWKLYCSLQLVWAGEPKQLLYFYLTSVGVIDAPDS